MAVLLHLRHRLLSRPTVAGIACTIARGERRCVCWFRGCRNRGSSRWRNRPRRRRLRAPSSPLVNALDQCRQIADAAQRLACYDRAAPAPCRCQPGGRGHRRRPRPTSPGAAFAVRLLHAQAPVLRRRRQRRRRAGDVETTIKSRQRFGYGTYPHRPHRGRMRCGRRTRRSIGLREPSRARRSRSSAGRSAAISCASTASAA